MPAPEIHAVLLAGGSGTRFWPASRRDLPKQFLAITGGEPLIRETLRRLDGAVPPERILVVTASGQEGLVRAALPELPRENVLIEPTARNTGPAIALAAAEIERRSPRSVQFVLPSDHVIRPVEAFQATLRAAALEAEDSGALVTLGVRPTHPATGFGYIHAAEKTGERAGIRVHRVAHFVEKPDRARAEAFLAAGTFYWNSGMFVWRTDAIVAALGEHLPHVRDALARVRAGEPLASAYPLLEPVSIDVGVLEKARNVRMLPIDYFWSDVGSWDALEAVNPRDRGENTCTGGAQLFQIDASGCIVHAPEGEITGLIGVKDLVVVHARGATLVCTKERAQEVKRLVELLAAERPDAL